MATDGELTIANKHFKWELIFSPVDEAKGKYRLYAVDLVASWQDGRRQIRLVKNAYALYEKK